jgi:hypothetical protein
MFAKKFAKMLAKKFAKMKIKVQLSMRRPLLYPQG